MDFLWRETGTAMPNPQPFGVKRCEGADARHPGALWKARTQNQKNRLGFLALAMPCRQLNSLRASISLVFEGDQGNQPCS